MNNIFLGPVVSAYDGCVLSGIITLRITAAIFLLTLVCNWIKQHSQNFLALIRILEPDEQQQLWFRRRFSLVTFTVSDLEHNYPVGKISRPYIFINANIEIAPYNHDDKVVHEYLESKDSILAVRNFILSE